MNDRATDIRIECGCPDDVEIAAVVAVLVAALRAQWAEKQPAAMAAVTLLRGPVLVPPAAWTAGATAA